MTTLLERPPSERDEGIRILPPALCHLHSARSGRGHVVRLSGTNGPGTNVPGTAAAFCSQKNAFARHCAGEGGQIL